MTPAQALVLKGFARRCLGGMAPNAALDDLAKATGMSQDTLEKYLRHIDTVGTDMVWETAQSDKHLSEEEKAAVQAYVLLKKPTKNKRKM